MEIFCDESTYNAATVAEGGIFLCSNPRKIPDYRQTAAKEEKPFFKTDLQQ